MCCFCVLVLCFFTCTACVSVAHPFSACSAIPSTRVVPCFRPCSFVYGCTRSPFRPKQRHAALVTPRSAARSRAAAPARVVIRAINIQPPSPPPTGGEGGDTVVSTVERKIKEVRWMAPSACVGGVRVHANQCRSRRESLVTHYGRRLVSWSPGSLHWAVLVVLPPHAVSVPPFFAVFLLTHSPLLLYLAARWIVGYGLSGWRSSGCQPHGVDRDALLWGPQRLPRDVRSLVVVFLVACCPVLLAVAGVLSVVASLCTSSRAFSVCKQSRLLGALLSIPRLPPPLAFLC